MFIFVFMCPSLSSGAAWDSNICMTKQSAENVTTTVFIISVELVPSALENQ